MNGATTIQERLKDLRLNKGLKLEELAEQTGISKSALGSYEKDDYKEINHGNLILLADFYGVSLDYLFCRTENRAEINTPLRELHLSDEMVALLTLRFMWMGLPPCRFKTSTPLSIPSGMKSLNGIAPAKMTPI